MSISGDALGALGLWLTKREREQERDDAAIRLVLQAVIATKQYIAVRNSRGGQDVHAERDLAKAWTDAAVAIRHSNPELADRFFLKAEYWTDPNTWTADEVTDNQIRIVEIAKSARALLRTGE